MHRSPAHRPILSAICLIGLTAGPLPAQEEASPIAVGQITSGSLTSADPHRYVMDLEARQFVRGAVEQVSVDVVVTVLGPDGSRVGRFDGPTRGTEAFRFETRNAGRYRIEVAPFEDERGEYRLTVAHVEPVATEPGARVGQLIDAYDRGDVPGGVVAVVRGGELVFARAFGAADLTHGIPFSIDTRTNIGSTSKQFTAMAILLLAQQEELSLDDDVRQHIPELPDLGATVTLRHLLTHTSGYRELFNTLALGGRRIDHGDHIDRDELIAVVQAQPELQNAPGSEFNYNNTGFGLLATVVERISGESFADWMAGHVFAPLGMQHTMVRAHPEQIVPDRANGYVPGDGGFREGSDLAASTGAGGIYTTVEDLVRWVRNYRTGELGGTAAIAQMTTPYTLTSGRKTGYGFGLFIDELRGLERVHHGGADTAHRSMVMYFPDLDAAVITQSNNATFPGAVAEAVAEAFFGDHMEPRPAGSAAEASAFDPESFAAESFDTLAGRYEMEELPGFVLTFTREGDTLFIQATGQPRIEIVPTSATTFRLTAVEASVTFHRREDGSVESLTLHQNGDHPARRVEAESWEPDAEDLQKYAGRYFSEELGTFYEISVDEGSLVLEHRRLEPVPLTPGAEHEFSGTFPVAEARFEVDQDGRVTGLTVGNGRTRGVRFTRVE